MSELEQLASKLHDIYQEEAKQQGDVRHTDAYAKLPENIKEFDRVLARHVLSRETDIKRDANLAIEAWKLKVRDLTEEKAAIWRRAMELTLEVVAEYEGAISAAAFDKKYGVEEGELDAALRAAFKQKGWVK